jgi:Tol biopolymer transport system component
MRKDGLEFIFVSNRLGGSGSSDLWSSTRASTEDPWPDPVNLTSVNSTATDYRPTLSFDGRMLIFASGRFGNGDLYVSTRTKLPASR